MLLPKSKLLSLMILAPLLSLASPACQDRKQPSAPLYEEPNKLFEAELKPLLDRYVSEAKDRGAPVDPTALKELKQLTWTSEISKGFSKTSINLGRCIRLNENHPNPAMRYRVVQIIKPDAQQMAGTIKMDANTLRAVVYHELGHCLHNFTSHRPNTEDSIMSTALPKSRTTRMDELVEEHFLMMGKKSTDNLRPF